MSKTLKHATFGIFVGTYVLFCSCLAQEIETVPLTSLEYSIYGKDSLERGMYAALIDKNNFIVTGQSYGKSREGDIMLWKVRHDLTVVEERNIGVNGFDFAFSGIKDSKDNIVMSGFTNKNGQGYDAYVVKINSGGDTIWTCIVGGEKDDRAYRAVETRDHGYVVIGQSNSWTADGNIDAFLFKLNSAGKLVWKKSFGDSTVDRTYSIITTPSDDIILSGLTNENYPGNADILIVRCTKDGDVVWQKKLGSMHGDIAHAMIKMNEKSFLIIGYTAEHAFPLSDPLIMRMDHDGNVIDKYTVKTGKDIKVMDGYMYSKDMFVGTGHIRDFSNGPSDPVLINFNFKTGKFILKRIEAGEADEEAYYALPMDKHTTMIVGHSFSTGNKKGDLMLIKWRQK